MTPTDISTWMTPEVSLQTRSDIHVLTHSSSLTTLIQYMIQTTLTTMGYFSNGCWTAHEDKMLELLVSTIGTYSWIQISHSMETRTTKQCRERYHNFVKPGLDHSPITPAEGETIVSMVEKIGRRWALISKRLENRSENAVKNWWYGYARRQSLVFRKAVRLESKRQKSNPTVQVATKQRLGIIKARSMRPQDTNDLQHSCYGNHDRVRVEKSNPRASDIEGLHQISTSTTVMNISTRTLPPISGLRIQKKLDQFREELKASLWRTQKQNPQTSPIQQASTIQYTSSAQHNLPSYDKDTAPLPGPPLILVTPPSNMLGMCVSSESMETDTPHRSTPDGSWTQYNQERWDYHHATAQRNVLPPRYLRSQDNKYATLTKV